MLKPLLKRLWRSTRPLRKPLHDRAEAFAAASLARALEAHNPTKRLADEVNLVLDTLLSEHFRLQARVDALQDQLREALERTELGTQ